MFCGEGNENEDRGSLYLSLVITHQTTHLLFYSLSLSHKQKGEYTHRLKAIRTMYTQNE